VCAQVRSADTGNNPDLVALGPPPPAAWAVAVAEAQAPAQALASIDDLDLPAITCFPHVPTCWPATADNRYGWLALPTFDGSSPPARPRQ
jgi:hypothetical protein